MNNVLLGKTIKAMYKMSGKTLTQLSDETGLSVDTINNLFYARIQKPGLDGVNTLVNAMGFSLQQVMEFLQTYPDLPQNADVTELFATTVSPVPAAENAVQAANNTAEDTKGEPSSQIGLLQAEHDKQLQRFRATNEQYVKQIQEQHHSQIEQMQAHNRQMEEHYNHSVTELRSIHAQETQHLEGEIVRARRLGKILGIAIAIETGIILILLILDFINRNIGWMR